MSRFSRLLAVLFAIGIAAAQETIHHASVSGRVTDPSGAVVEHAQVTARQVETNVSQAAETDREGEIAPIVTALLDGECGERNVVEHRREKAETERCLP